MEVMVNPKHLKSGEETFLRDTEMAAKSFSNFVAFAKNKSGLKFTLTFEGLQVLASLEGLYSHCLVLIQPRKTSP